VTMAIVRSVSAHTSPVRARTPNPARAHGDAHRVVTEDIIRMPFCVEP